jgi:hypothetical protein
MMNDAPDGMEMDAASIGRDLGPERVIITNDFVPIATCLLELCGAS